MIQALGNLNTVQVIDHMRPFIYGDEDTNPRIRSAAISALGRGRLPFEARNEVSRIFIFIKKNWKSP